MMNEHERVVQTTALPRHGLEAGDMGTVVHPYEDRQAYEVEFLALDGRTAAVVTVEAAQARPVTGREITHARLLATRSQGCSPRPGRTLRPCRRRKERRHRTANSKLTR
ncbi:MAG: DUF4926 domain-containing protein [Verrucomicrobia bacterium]|nr:DUF4926 domain-containing protein [Verrucomicrobiota bacterium]